MPEFRTYRFTGLPKHIKLADLPDAHLARASSIAPCPETPDTFNVATVTFQREPSFAERLRQGAHLIPVDGGNTVRVDADFYGITPLHSTSGENVRADIIAITGLAGRAFESWQNENGQMWLRDFLPLRIPNVRVCIYGYPSKLQQSPSRALVPDFTEGLIRDILRFRKKPEEATIPLILVGHSLGCLLIKAAVVKSMSLEDTVPEILQPLCGMVFFGAPHRGLNNPELEDLLEGKPPAALLSDLRPESSLLIALNQRFPVACKHIRVISCYETHETASPQRKDPNNPDSGWARTGPTRFLVPRASACLDWAAEKETRIPVHADHSKIAKLDSIIGSEVHEITAEIGRIVDAAPAAVMLRRAAFGLAGIDPQLPDVFASLQFEHAWLVGWAAAVSDVSGLPRDSERPVSTGLVNPVPYGHPAYPAAAEANAVLESLAHVLREHAIPNVEGGEELDPPHVTLIGLPSSFQRCSPATGTSAQEVTSAPASRTRITFSTAGWTGDERARFSTLVSQLRQVNEMLSGFVKGPASSIDLTASAMLLHPWAFQTPDIAPHLPAMAGIYDRHQELSHRASLQQQQLGLMQREPRILPLESINKGDNVANRLSNYRVVSALDDPDEKVGSIPANPREKPWVLIEWRSYATALDSAVQTQAKEQAKRIAYDLGAQKKPTGLRTLDCIGLVQDREALRFGLLFKMPRQADVTVGPITLHSYLCGDKLDGRPIPYPTLGDRIQLARMLACSLAEMHVVGILHKNFHSGNVLFFPARSTRHVSVREPYVGGFEVSRPEHDPSLSASVGSTGFDLYRHPELRDAISNELQGRPSSSRKHDIYSLGLVLLEIGVWAPLKGIKTASAKPMDVANRYAQVARTNLPRTMGPLYCQAVLECIDTKSLATEDHLFLAEKVVKLLEQCQCRA